MDTLTKERRTENMRNIRHRDTRPEVLVRKSVTALGYRYRLHVKELPGKPDLVLRRLKAVVFVHGCFWHQHTECREGRLPRSGSGYWTPKLLRNVERDRSHLNALTESGWNVLVLWECQIEKDDVTPRIKEFLEECAARIAK